MRTTRPLADSKALIAFSAGLSIDLLPFPYLVVGDGIVQYANRAAHEVFGLANTAALIGRRLTEFATTRWTTLASSIPSAWEPLGDLDWRRTDGAEFRADTFTRQQGIQLHVLLHASGSRERAETELARMGDDGVRMEALGGLGRYELHGAHAREDWFSNGFFEIVGRDPARGTFSGEDYLREIVHPDDRALVAGSLASANATGAPFELEYRIVRPGGEVRYVRSSGAPRFDANGAVVGLRGALVDVTKLVQSATELRHQGVWLSAILDTAIEAVLLIDSRGIVKSVNLATQRIFGYAPEELRGRSVNLLMPAPDRNEHDGILAHELATGARRSIGTSREVSGLRKDGTRFPMQLAVSEMRLGGEPMFGVFVRDLTESKRLESELLQAQKNEIVGQVSEGIAHDFNNLLMGIRSCARLAEEPFDDHDPTRLLLGEIEATTQRGASMTRRLLAFGRSGSAQYAPIGLSSVVQESAPLWRRLVGEEIDLVVTCAPEGDVLMGTAVLLEQILINLVVNARDAMPNGGHVWIETRREGEHIVLLVRDEGSGMDAATRARIFEPFFTTKPPGKGTGLGLSTVIRIVRELSGEIEVESEAGRGTMFRIRFPVTAAAPRSIPLATVQARRVKSGHETILLVEDEALIRFAVRQSLAKLGYQVLAAADGEKALEIATAHTGTIDLVVTDVALPKLGGREVVERARERFPELRCIFMSGHAREALLRQGRIPEDAAYLEKPYDLSELALLVRQVLE